MIRLADRRVQMCASAPSLRVFFRSYLSGPVSRIRGSSKSDPSRSGRLDGESGLSGSRGAAALQRLGSKAEEELGHNLKQARHSKAIPVVETTEEDVQSLSRSSSYGQKVLRTPQDFEEVIKTPADFEAFNLHNMEKFRQSKQHERLASRGGQSPSTTPPTMRTMWENDSP